MREHPEWLTAFSCGLPHGQVHLRPHRRRQRRLLPREGDVHLYAVRDVGLGELAEGGLDPPSSSSSCRLFSSAERLRVWSRACLVFCLARSSFSAARSGAPS